MKHIVFILSGYYPYFSAVGVCVQNVISYLKDDYRITVLAAVNRYGQMKYDQHDACQIIRVCTPDVKKRLYFEKKSHTSSGISGKLASFCLLYERMIKYLRIIIKSDSIDHKLCEAYIEELYEIDSKSKIDVLIPVCIPFEAMLAAADYCSQSSDPPKLISYFFDPFSDNHSLHRTVANQKRKYTKHLSLEKRVLAMSSHTIIMEHLKKHFEQEFPDYMAQIHVMEHPMLCRPIGEQESIHITKPIQITYAGSFNKGIREPDFLLQVISLLEGEMCWNIYAAGNCMEQIKKYAQQYPDRLRFFGQVEKREADQAIACSDFILSVGNITANQSPSKIFECLATGKPIIHLFYYEEDPVIRLLSGYPNSLCVKISQEVTENTLRQLQNFLNSEHSIISFGEVATLYRSALPQTTAEAIRAFIRE